MSLRLALFGGALAAAVITPLAVTRPSASSAPLQRPDRVLASQVSSAPRCSMGYRVVCHTDVLVMGDTILVTACQTPFQDTYPVPPEAEESEETARGTHLFPRDVDGSSHLILRDPEGSEWTALESLLVRLGDDVDQGLPVQVAVGGRATYEDLLRGMMTARTASRGDAPHVHAERSLPYAGLACWTTRTMPRERREHPVRWSERAANWLRAGR